MDIYDLRRGAIRPKDFEDILSPLFVRHKIDKYCYLEKSTLASSGDFDGYQLKRIYGLKPIFVNDISRGEK